MCASAACAIPLHLNAQSPLPSISLQHLLTLTAAVPKGTKFSLSFFFN